MWWRFQVGAPESRMSGTIFREQGRPLRCVGLAGLKPSPPFMLASMMTLPLAELPVGFERLEESKHTFKYSRGWT